MSGSLRKKRTELFDLQDGRCAACGKPMKWGAHNDPMSVSIDHVFPASRGGRSTWDNVLLKHRKCNEVKANNLPSKNDLLWVEKIKRARQLRSKKVSNVIELKFRSPHVEDGERALLACRNCRNKTYLLVDDKPESFPLMQCAACGCHMGRMGWAHDDDPMIGDPA